MYRNGQLAGELIVVVAIFKHLQLGYNRWLGVNNGVCCAVELRSGTVQTHFQQLNSSVTELE